MTTRVALVTSADFPTGEDFDGDLLLRACEAAGLAASWTLWDAPGMDWSSFDLAVVRSTWDYPPRREEYLRWADSVPALANPAEVIRWSSSKIYLRDLAVAGVPVVPTQFVEPADDARWPESGEFVVKPAVGAGSLGVGRFAAPADLDAAQAHLEALHEHGRVAMIQPYIEGIDEAGETALMYLGGRFSHAIRKGPMLPPSHVHRLLPEPGQVPFVAEAITPRQPSAEELRVADVALAAVPAGSGLLYARVDLLPTAAGPIVGEIELVEPSLFLQHADGAADRFAAAIAEVVASRRASR
ncbi:MAG: ATP-grasp domain-containing protein [Jatrophihabitans sp.]